LLHQVQFDEKGGERTFAAVGSNGGNAQKVTFAKSKFHASREYMNGPMPTFVPPVEDGWSEPILQKCCNVANVSFAMSNTLQNP
jgi:hypothetical protein